MADTNNPIEAVDITWLKEYEANAKKHPPEQVESLARSIEKFGWTSYIVAWKDGTIIAGHGRFAAAKLLGRKKVPVIVRRDLTRVQADALRLADNRVVSTEYDQPAIMEELQRLSSELDGTFEMSDLGFTDKELTFSLSDFDEMTDNLFVDDISEAVEEQKSQNAEKVEQTDDIAAPIGDALGFKRVTLEQSRQLKNLMSGIEAKTGQKGVDALLTVLFDAQKDK